MYSFTLEDLKAAEWGEHPMATTAFNMKNSGFHRWGFAIYRTTYDDDVAWERYLEVLRLTARKHLARLGGDVLLEQYMDCKWTPSPSVQSATHSGRCLTNSPSGPVVSDPVGLDGASKADVRRHFKSWCAGRSEERDGPGAANDRAAQLPRFKHCLYVDRRCLDTLSRMPAIYGDLRDSESNVVAVVIDGTFDERTRDSDQGLHPAVEGCTEWYVGWRYDDIGMVASTFQKSHEYPLSDEQTYKRPPLISPFGFKSMPT